MTNQITEEKIDEMYDAYKEKQTISHVSTVCRLSRDSVRKYIQKGDPKRDVESLEVRLLMEKQRSAAQNQQTAVEKPQNAPVGEAERHRRENLAMVRKFKGLIAKLLNEIEGFDITTVTPLKLSMILESLPKIEKYLQASAQMTDHEASVQTLSSIYPPAVMSKIARILLDHKRQVNDRESDVRRQVEANELAIKEGRHHDVMPIIDAEFKDADDPEAAPTAE